MVVASFGSSSTGLPEPSQGCICNRMQPLGLGGVPDVEGHLDHFADLDCFDLTTKRERHEGALEALHVAGSTLPEMEFARLVLPRTSHRERHVWDPCVRLRDLQER